MLFSLSREVELAGDLVSARQRAQFLPRRILDLDTVLAALLLAQIFDLARIEHAAGAFRRRRRFQIAGELRDLASEILERAERGDIEHRHEASVIVPAGRLDAEAEAGEEAAQ